MQELFKHSNVVVFLEKGGNFNCQKDVKQEHCSTSYFYMHGMVATQHLEPMEWVKFKAETVVRESLGASKPSSL